MCRSVTSRRRQSTIHNPQKNNVDTCKQSRSIAQPHVTKNGRNRSNRRFVTRRRVPTRVIHVGSRARALRATRRSRASGGCWLTHRRRRMRRSTRRRRTNARGCDGKKIPCVTSTRFQPRVAFASMRKPASTMTDGSRGVHRRAILPSLSREWVDGWVMAIGVDVPMRPKPLMATLTLASVTTLTLACDDG